MLLGYNTNGWAHHDPLCAISLLAELGYKSVAITLDHGCLNPFDPDLPRQIEAVRSLLDQLKLRSVVETGARYLLDPRVKHEPTLVSALAEDRARRVDFLNRAIDIAAALSSDCVSLWSGVVHDGATSETAWRRLTEGLKPVLDHAAARRVIVGFEPEPGMFIDTLGRFAELSTRLPDERLKLTLDIGHLHCLGEVPIAAKIGEFSGRIVNIHIEDMRAGKHEHLMFGEGEIDFPPVIAALQQAGYRGGLHVELSRHSHAAVEAARQAYEFLSPLLGELAG
jgi:sugar phosphate isomerase/epimerase